MNEPITNCKHMKPVNCGCGGEAEVRLLPLCCGLRHEEIEYAVVCRKCRTRTEYKDSEAEAIMTWNRAMGTAEKSSIVERTAKVVNYEDPSGLGGYGDCSECWAEVNEQYTYCPNCGAKLDWSERDE